VAMLLIVLAVVLAGTAALLRLRRHGPPAQAARPYELIHDGQGPSVDHGPGLSATPRAGSAGMASAQRRGEMLGGAALVGGSTGALYPDTGSASDTDASPDTSTGTGPDKAAASRDPADADHSRGGPTAHAVAGGDTTQGSASRGAGGDTTQGSANRTGANATPGAAGRGSGGAGDRNAEAKALCDAAENALAEGDSARAFQLAGSSLKQRRTARAYVLRARAEQRLGRVDDALNSLDAATEIAPTAGSVWEQRGRILWAARRRDEARAAFSRFLELSPNAASAAEVQRLLNEPR